MLRTKHFCSIDMPNFRSVRQPNNKYFDRSVQNSNQNLTSLYL